MCIFGCFLLNSVSFPYHFVKSLSYPVLADRHHKFGYKLCVWPGLLILFSILAILHAASLSASSSKAIIIFLKHSAKYLLLRNIIFLYKCKKTSSQLL